MGKKTNLFIFLSLLLIALPFSKTYSTDTDAYQGPIYNIFFHPLIVYPKLAFKPSNPHLNYVDAWFVTEAEFKKILSALYKRGFVLVSPTDIFEENKIANGQLIITKKNLFLPVGKKPLILSLDDYNYYKTMKQNGTIHRFWVDKKGKLLTVTNNGHVIIRNDQEVPQLLEKFITQHPDFSYNNARGIIALTGYNGILGYQTSKTRSKAYRSQVAEAKKVVQKLKQMGWQFASHSYFHLGEDKLPENAFEESEKRWLEEVGSIVGATPYYVFPFGDPWNENPARMTFLKSLGYRYFFGVSSVMKLNFEPGAVVMTRFPVDGNALRGKYGKNNEVKLYLNPDETLDSLRISIP